MVAMASDSYLLKTAAQPPCQACCRASDSTACRATSCGVVVTLVLLLAAVVGLGGVLYYQRMMLCSVLADLSSMERIIQRVDTNIVRLHQELQYKTFGVEHKDPEEEEALSDDSDGDGDSDDVDYDLADYDDGLLYQNNNPMGTTTPRSEDNEPLARDRHSVLGQGKNGLATTPAILKETESDSSEARGTGETDEGHIWRWRRDVGLATGRRADPQLRLYHMLQAPDHAVPFAAAPEGTWSQRGQHRGPGFLPMYAEHAPLEYVMPPRANIATTPSPIASRRSRVMAGPPAAAVPGRLQPSQFDRHPHQHGQLEGAEAARRQDGRATRRRRPSPTQAQAVPSRSPWRGVRVIDTFHQ